MAADTAGCDMCRRPAARAALPQSHTATKARSLRRFSMEAAYSRS